MARSEHAVLGFVNESNAGNFPEQLERRSGESTNGAKPHSFGGLDPAGLALTVACHRLACPPRLVGDDFQSASDDLLVERLRHARRTSNVALGSVQLPVGLLRCVQCSNASQAHMTAHSTKSVINFAPQHAH